MEAEKRGTIVLTHKEVNAACARYLKEAGQEAPNWSFRWMVNGNEIHLEATPLEEIPEGTSGILVKVDLSEKPKV